MRSKGTIAVLFIVTLAATAGWFFLRGPRQDSSRVAATTTNKPMSTPPAVAAAHVPEPDRTAAAAHAYCQACHLFPEPDILDKQSWLGALNQMALWLGVARIDLSKRSDGMILQEAHVFPPSPIVSEEDWDLINRFYLENAPAEPRPAPTHSPVQSPLKNFRVRKIDARAGTPRTSLLKIDSRRRQLDVGDAQTHTLEIFSAAGHLERRFALPNDPVALEERPEGWCLTLIGHLLPSDELQGSIGFLDLEKNTFRPFLENLRRPTDSTFADLNRDGLDDQVVAQFGNRLGHFSWFEKKGDGSYEEHVLIDRPGAVQSLIYDANHDGWPDIFVLMAQGREGLYLLLNQKNGTFQEVTITEQHPAFGYSHFELVDFDRDGQIDILTSNGDNGDYPGRAKGYHGVRLYLNEGGSKFRQVFFRPLNGAYKVLARDFDGDGDLDIAAISFFPDFERAPDESFVLLENKGGMNFEAFSFPESRSGRWLTMDAADLDGDGDIDLALGSFLPGPTTIPIPPAVINAWQSNGVSVLILENLTK